MLERPGVVARGSIYAFLFSVGLVVAVLAIPQYFKSDAAGRQGLTPVIEISGDPLAINEIDSALSGSDPEEDLLVERASVAGALYAVASPSATLQTALEVSNTEPPDESVSDGWKSTQYQIEGQSAVCVDHSNHSSSDTDSEGFDITAPATAGIYDITYTAYDNDTCTSNDQTSPPFTLTDAIEVGIFGDSFGIVDIHNYTLNGWADADGNGTAGEVHHDNSVASIIDDNYYMRIREKDNVKGRFTRSNISTVGNTNVQLRYKWGQKTDDDADNGDLVVEWKPSSSSIWINVNTHDLARDVETSPVTQVTANLGASASNTSIDIRFTGDTTEYRDEGRVDDVIVSVAPGAPPTPTPTPTPQADLSITKTDNVSTATPGQPLTYTIVVSNAGPTPVVDALVSDIFPVGSVVENWSCVAQNSANCTLNGSTDINDLVYLPTGGILTYTVLTRVVAGTTGTISNTATVTPPAGIIDPNPSNNSATDTDTVVVAISGNIKQFVQGGPNTNLSGATVALSGTTSGGTTTDANGNYSFTNLPSGGNFTVTPSGLGRIYDPISRSFSTVTANITGADFVAYDGNNGNPRNLRVVQTNVTPGQPAIVPIVISSQGTEKSIAFSLIYDFGPLTSPVFACGAGAPGCTLVVNNIAPGNIGVSVTAVTPFAAGLREVVTVTFQTGGAFNVPNAAVNFSGSPTGLSIKDSSNNELPFTTTNGLVIFALGIESDIAGRNIGDGNVLSNDVTQIRDAVVGNLILNPAFNEFQRADSSPLSTKGDGQIDATDTVQARRYAARLNEIRPVGGPGAPIAPIANPEPAPFPLESRSLRVVSANASPGTRVTVAVELAPNGDEVAASFTLNFDPLKLRNPVVELGSEMPAGVVLTKNISQAEGGRLGILLDAETALAVSSAPRQMLSVTFDVAADAAGGETPVTFTSSLATRGTSDATANRLPTAYADGAVTIAGIASASAEISGRVLTPDGRGVRNATVTFTASNGAVRTAVTSSFGFYRFENAQVGETYTVGVSSKRYRFAARVIDLNGNLSNIDFLGME